MLNSPSPVRKTRTSIATGDALRGRRDRQGPVAVKPYLRGEGGATVFIFGENCRFEKKKITTYRIIKTEFSFYLRSSTINCSERGNRNFERTAPKIFENFDFSAFKAAWSFDPPNADGGSRLGVETEMSKTGLPT